MILYDLAASMSTRRVRIFLAEKDIKIPVKMINGLSYENYTEEFLKKNPLGKLPVLELDDGTFLSESISICRYIELIYPNKPLFGSDKKEKAIIDMWLRRIEFEIANPIAETFMHSSEYFKKRINQMPEYAEWAKKKVIKNMEWLNNELINKEFIATKTYSIADIVAQCAFVLGKAVGIRINSDLENLSLWFETVTKRETARV
tara:strand:- start:979 stop:1587 length:609 start_codon:yes stop_codon:yes gene_type:complete